MAVSIARHATLPRRARRVPSGSSALRGRALAQCPPASLRARCYGSKGSLMGRLGRLWPGRLECTSTPLLGHVLTRVGFRRSGHARWGEPLIATGIVVDDPLDLPGSDRRRPETDRSPRGHRPWCRDPRGRFPGLCASEAAGSPGSRRMPAEPRALDRRVQRSRAWREPACRQSRPRRRSSARDRGRQSAGLQLSCSARAPSRIEDRRVRCPDPPAPLRLHAPTHPCPPSSRAVSLLSRTPPR